MGVRGSGTSGYVQTNRFNLRRTSLTQKTTIDSKNSNLLYQKMPNKSILKHSQQREKAAKVIKLQFELELQGFDINHVIEKVFKSLKELKKRSRIDFFSINFIDESLKETHAIAARKLKKMEALAAALGIQ